MYKSVAQVRLLFPDIVLDRDLQVWSGAQGEAAAKEPAVAECASGLPVTGRAPSRARVLGRSAQAVARLGVTVRGAPAVGAGRRRRP